MFQYYNGTCILTHGDVHFWSTTLGPCRYAPGSEVLEAENGGPRNLTSPSNTIVERLAIFACPAQLSIFGNQQIF